MAGIRVGQVHQREMAPMDSRPHPGPCRPDPRPVSERLALVAAVVGWTLLGTLLPKLTPLKIPAPEWASLGGPLAIAPHRVH